jgi:N-acetylneuraminic acid mutarotase
MRLRRLAPLLAATLLGTSTIPATGSRTLTLEDRIRAREAIERVRYAHQIGATRPFETAVPRRVIEAAVRRDLELSVSEALTPAALEAEVGRMERDTRMPDRLEEMFAALGHDPLLIQQCLALPAITSRLTADRARTPAVEAAACTTGDTWGTVEAQPALQDQWMTAVWTGNEMLVWGGFSSQGSSRPGGRYDPAIDTWLPMSTSNAPANRYWHQAIWTGNEMIIWGGTDGTDRNTGARYDPIANSWASTSTDGAPSPRVLTSAVWTGTEMLVWGGYEEDNGLALDGDGARYDPARDTWSPMSNVGAPQAREGHTAVWTGNRMVVWGGNGRDAGGIGSNLATGGVYEPSTDTWSPVSQAGAPQGRVFHAALWTGDRMIVYGGFGNAGSADRLNDGGRYDPATDSWSATSTTGAPGPLGGLTAIWTGHAMIVWGGCDDSGCPAEGGLYDPAADTWSPTSTEGAPQGRAYHCAVWTGNEMIVFGGITPSVAMHGDGGRYTPASVSDTDGDGVCDQADACPSSDLRDTVSIGTCETGVTNTLDSVGCSLQDRIDACATAEKRGGSTRCVATLTHALFREGLLSGRERGRILGCLHGHEVPPRP